MKIPIVPSPLNSHQNLELGTGEVPCCEGAPAFLARLELENFMAHENYHITFSRLQVVIGSNASGKSSIIEAIRFVLLVEDGTALQNLTFRADPPKRFTQVTAHFECEDKLVGCIALRRQAEAVDSDSQGVGHFATRFFVARGGGAFCALSEDSYRKWISQVIKLDNGSFLLRQYKFLTGHGLLELLRGLPQALKTMEAEETSTCGPLLKRRRKSFASSIEPAPAPQGMLHAKLTRRIEEIYFELSRQPLDEEMTTWGDGCQAMLRRSADGAFVIYVSEEKGLAAAGYGTPASALSRGEQDLLALSLLLAMRAPRQAELPDFVFLDEPDARLDRRHTAALRQFLSGPLGPRQSVILSLDNHEVFRRSDGNGLVEL